VCCGNLVQVGTVYEFSASLACGDSSCVSVTETHRLTYLYSDLVCQIKYLVTNRPKTVEECVNWVRNKFCRKYNHRIRQLLNNFPKDAMTKEYPNAATKQQFSAKTFLFVLLFFRFCFNIFVLCCRRRFMFVCFFVPFCESCLWCFVFLFC